MVPGLGGPTLPAVFTVGHSTRSIRDFIALLDALGVTLVVDVRTVPRSRRSPHFNKDALSRELKDRGMVYLHMKELGGFRKPAPDSPNRGWRDEGLRGFSDYMLTAEFGESLSRLLSLTISNRVALMCAEALPWRCHRSLISDALAVRGVRVGHIIDSTRCDAHRITPWAHVEGTRITYPLHLRDPLAGHEGDL